MEPCSGRGFDSRRLHLMWAHTNRVKRDWRAGERVEVLEQDRRGVSAMNFGQAMSGPAGKADSQQVRVERNHREYRSIRPSDSDEGDRPRGLGLISVVAPVVGLVHELPKPWIFGIRGSDDEGGA